MEMREALERLSASPTQDPNQLEHVKSMFGINIPFSFTMSRFFFPKLSSIHKKAD
jgi:hypothetical protein